MNETELPKTYEIKRPLRKTGIVFFYISLAMCFLILTIYNLNRNEYISSTNSMHIIMITTYLIIAIILLVQNVRLKPRQITLLQDGIEIYHFNIENEKIDVILFEGYFKPVIGIKLKGKKLVSSKHMFSFKGDQDTELKAFKEWAGRKGLKIKEGSIITWI